MKDLSSIVSSEETTVESSSLSEDFNSENAFCEKLSDGTGPSEVEILGMDLLLSEEDEVASDFIDDSETDFGEDEVDRLLQRTVDSLELARQRLSHGVTAQNNRNTNLRRRKATSRRVCFRGGEVDSLILTRERMPHLIHNFTDNIALMMHLFEEGRGLMGEVDSLVLDKKRLPNVVHGYERSNNGESKIQRNLRATRVEVNTVPDVKYTKLSGLDNESTSSTESSSSFDTLFTVDTVDSLILTRRRLASHPPRSYYESARTISEIHQTTNLAAGNNSEHNKLPAKPGIGLGTGLHRQSSGACAA